MGFWQWVMICVWGFNLLMGLIMHNKEMREKDGMVRKYRFERVLAGTIISFFILYCGGFFK